MYIRNILEKTTTNRRTSSRMDNYSMERDYRVEPWNKTNTPEIRVLWISGAEGLGVCLLGLPWVWAAAVRLDLRPLVGLRVEQPQVVFVLFTSPDSTRHC